MLIGMSIHPISVLNKRAINFRLIVITFALLTLIAMQHGLIRHALDHLAKAQFQTSVSLVSDQTAQLLTAGDSKDTGGEVTCSKCLEDIAHTVVLPSDWSMASVQTVHILAQRALEPNQIFLSPERANQRGPPFFA